MVSAIRSISSRSFAWCLGLALFVGGIGLYPHLRFSWEVSALSYFKAAYDEDYYALISASNGSVAFYRIVSSWILESVRRLLDNRLDIALVALDGLLPALCAVAAWRLSACIAQRVLLRALFTLCILFAPDLLSMGSAPIWGDHKWNLAFLRTSFPGGNILIPDAWTSYLTLYRTPEPQWAWFCLFLQQTILLTILGKMERGIGVGWPSQIWLAMINLILSFSYIFVSLPAFGQLMALAGVLALQGKYREMLIFARSLMIPTALILFGLLSYFGKSDSGTQVFSSRIPEIAPSSILSMMLMAGWIWVIARKGMNSFAAYGVILAALPLLLLNQQLLTGYMVSAKDWERSINYELIVLSGALLFREFADGAKRTIFFRYGPAGGLILLYVLLCSTEGTYQAWVEQNRESVAIARALSATPPEKRTLPIVLEKPSLIPLVSLRSGLDQFPGSYNALFAHPVSDLGGRDWKTHVAGLEQKYWLYEVLFRRGVTPDELHDLLRQEAVMRSGYHTAFFFSFLDYWYPASDNRKVRTEQIRQAIPWIVAEYAGLIAHPPVHWLKPGLLVTSKPRKFDGRFDYELLARDRLSGKRAYVYLQYVP